MIFNAKNGTAAGADYIRFGTGKKTLIMLPGLGDGLRTTKGTALPLALYYRSLTRDYTVYVFSRKAELPKGHTTRDMARDLKEAMTELRIQRASLVGVSMGGMIAQHLAIDYPERVGKLVLAVTSARANPVLIDSVKEWMDQARRGDHTALMDSNVKKIYSDAYYRKNKWLVPVMGKVTKPKSYDRFLKQAEACLNHDAFHGLEQIQTPTLVIGGEKDRVLGSEAAREIAARIHGAQLLMYEKWGHGVYEEETAFNRSVQSFLME